MRYVVIIAMVIVMVPTVAVGQSKLLEHFSWYNSTSIGGHDEAWHVHELSDGKFVVTGFTTDEQDRRQAFFYKVDSNGDPLLLVVYDGVGESQGYELHPVYDATGGFIFAGRTTENGFDQALVIRLDDNFGTIWKSPFWDDDPGDGSSLTLQMGAFSIQRIISPSPAGFIVAGFTRSYDGSGQTTNSETDAMLLRIDTDGHFVWIKQIDAETTGDEYEVLKSVKVAPFGFVAAGFVRRDTPAGGQFDIWLAKFDWDGVLDLNWPNMPFATEDLGEFGSSVAQTFSGPNPGWMVAGTSYPINKPRGYLAKVKDDGTILWQHNLDLAGNKQEYFQSVITLDLGTYDEYVAAGISLVGLNENKTDALIAKINGSGGLGYKKNFGNANSHNYIYWIQATQDGGFVVCGTTTDDLAPTDGESNIFLARFTTDFMCGDFNGSRSLTSADIIYLVNYVFKGGPEPPGGDNQGNVNGSGDCSNPTVTSADVIYLVDMVNGGPSLPNCLWCAMP